MTITLMTEEITSNDSEIPLFRNIVIWYGGIRRFENDSWHETSDKDTAALRRRP
jgi:hypothetical protein